MRLLIAHGAKVNARDRQTGMTALRMCAEFGLKPDAPSALSAGRGYTAVAESLLQGGADPNIRDSHGYTALHWAARHRQLRMVQRLIAHGADVNARTKSGLTVLMMAVPGGSAAVVKLLMGHGADVNAKIEGKGHTYTALLAARQREEDARKDPPRSSSFPNASDYATIIQLLKAAGAKE